MFGYLSLPSNLKEITKVHDKIAVLYIMRKFMKGSQEYFNFWENSLEIFEFKNEKLKEIEK